MGREVDDERVARVSSISLCGRVVLATLTVR